VIAITLRRTSQPHTKFLLTAAYSKKTCLPHFIFNFGQSRSVSSSAPTHFRHFRDLICRLRTDGSPQQLLRGHVLAPVDRHEYETSQNSTMQLKCHVFLPCSPAILHHFTLLRCLQLGMVHTSCLPRALRHAVNVATTVIEEFAPVNTAPETRTAAAKRTA
jgi:hypothetical protein